MYAQLNLVPNPGFEEADTCNRIMMKPYRDLSAQKDPHYWFSQANSPDYFKNCNPTAARTIIYGYYQLPRNGNAMIGIVANSNDNSISNTFNFKNYKENIAVQLSQKLQKENYYKVVFFVNLANYVSPSNFNIWITTSMGAHFSKTILDYKELPVKNLAPIIPQVINPANRYLFDTLGWDKIEGLYKAEGGEEWLTLGDFGNRNHDSLVFKDSSKPIYYYTYYLIDDVSVTYFDTTNHVMDTTLCRGRSLVYHKRPDWDSCIWYDGSSDSSKTFIQTGVYWVTNFYAGFIATDTIKLTIIDSLQTQIHHLGFCPNDSVLLTARLGNNYLWNNGATQQQQYVNQTNTFYVTSNTLGCLLNDTFYVKEYASPIIKGLQDTVVCFDDIKKIELDAGLHKTYLWQPTGETTRTILSTEANIYLLTVTDTTNCKSSQRVVVDEYCTFKFYVPNAFSPNGDGTNDAFKISIHPSRIQNFEVYNRWGQLIEQNQTGTWSGKDAQTDVYVIILTYTDDNGNTKRYWGNVTLLR